MLYFLFGEDVYRCQQKLKKIKDQAGLRSEVFVFEAQNMQFADFAKELEANSLFAKKKTLIVKNLLTQGDQGLKNKFLHNLDKLKNDLCIIIFYDSKPDKRLKLFKEINKLSQTEEFKPLQGKDLVNWLIEETGINNKLADKLIMLLGNDPGRLINEIGKIKAYYNYKSIPGDNVEKLVKPELENDIFKTIDALAQGDKVEILHFVQRHLASKDDENYLFNMFIYQFRNLLNIKKGQIQGISPFVVKKSRQFLNNYSLEKLEKIFKLFLRLDFLVKTGQLKQPATFFVLLFS